MARITHLEVSAAAPASSPPNANGAVALSQPLGRPSKVCGLRAATATVRAMARVKDYDTLWDHIERYEGRRQKAYVCTAGHPTIGIGFNLDRADAGAKLTALGFELQAVRSGGVTLTHDQVDELFEPDLAAAIDGAHRLVRTFDALSARRQHACVDLTFNLGTSGFGRFTKTLEALDAGRYAEAARELQSSRWYGQVGQRGPVVVAMMRDG